MPTKSRTSAGALMLSLIAAVSLLASCGGKGNADPGRPETGTGASAAQSIGPNGSDNPYTMSSVLEGDGATGGNLHTLESGAGDAKTAPKARPASNYKLMQKYPGVLMLRGSESSHQVALTFDDGPDNRFTPAVLDVLKKHHVKGTFFMMGSRIDGHPDMVKRVIREGHAVGNHTYWHPKLYGDSLDRTRWEVTQTEAAFKRAVGFVPRLFRAPFGGLTEDVLRELQRMNYHVIGWNVDSLDWTQAPKETVVRNVLTQMHPGAIVLMHSGGNWNQTIHGSEALEDIIPKLKAEGLRFVTIPEMFNIPQR